MASSRAVRQASEADAGLGEHWDGAFHFGAPDGIVVDVTKDQIWVREGIPPDSPNGGALRHWVVSGMRIPSHDESVRLLPSR